MKRFLKYITIFGLGLILPIIVTFCIRLMLRQSQVAESRHIEPWQKILFMGDSHIGCTFIEAPKYCNRVVWASSMPQQFTLMRLLDMERLGALRDVETLVLEIGLQSLGEQDRERMKGLWWRLFPISWRYPELIPLSTFDRLSYAAANSSMAMPVIEKMSTNDVSILTRTQKVRDSDFARLSDFHFDWIGRPEQMCVGWEESLHNAIAGIIDVCRRNNIKLLFLTAPVVSYYRAAIPEKVEQKLQEFIKQIKDAGIEYYDLRDWGEDDDFRDCFHFRLSGAQKFTDWFYKEILKR